MRKIVIEIYPHTKQDEIDEILETLECQGLDAHLEEDDEIVTHVRWNRVIVSDG